MKTTDRRPGLAWVLRGLVKRAIPPQVLNQTLLTFPFLYRFPIVRYESNLSKRHCLFMTSLLRSTLHLPGNIIECGSSRCGSAVIMSRVAPNKIVYACDSFQGFLPSEVMQQRLAGSIIGNGAFKSTSLAYVTEKLRRLKIQNVEIIPGYFQNTLNALEDDFCFAFIDCDLHDSVLFCLEQLTPRIVGGGIIVVDDYDSSFYLGCKQAVDGFMSVPRGLERVAYKEGMIAFRKR
jgi:predicted O-methyltransferase YrrM